MNEVAVFFLVLSALATLLCASILTAVVLTTRRKVAAWEKTFQAFVSAPDAQTPSPLAQTVDAAAQVMARAAIAQFRSTVMGLASGAARAEKSAQAQAAMSNFPWLAALDALSPGISKTLVRNPALLNLAASFINKQSAPAGPIAAPAPAPAPGNGRVQQAQFKL